MTRFRLKLGHCLEVMKDIPDNSFHSVVTDPPYGLNFMGKDWDHGIPGKVFWEEILRVSKPGAMLLAFGGTRTHHRLMVAIEDAGWEIRDTLMWLYGSGFPKSRDIGKDIQKREVGGIKNLEVIGHKQGIKTENGSQGFSYQKEYVPGISMGGRQVSGEIPVYKIDNEWKGWGTALKPAWEPIILAMKPLDGTFANNALKWGCGGLNIDASRISTNGEALVRPQISRYDNNAYGKGLGAGVQTEPQGRWPANLLLDEEAGKILDEQAGTSRSRQGKPRKGQSGDGWGMSHTGAEYADEGGASRFFYCSKASKKDRGEGNDHLTVKPTDLMRYLCRLVTPRNGIVFDPFMGSGSTGKAALLEGLRFYGIEKEKNYLEIAEKRVQAAYVESKKEESAIH